MMSMLLLLKARTKIFCLDVYVLDDEKTLSVFSAVSSNAFCMFFSVV